MLLFAVVVLVATALTAVRAEQVPPRRPPRISDEEDNTLARKFECPACTAAFWEIDHALWSAEHSPFRSSTKVDSNTPLTESEYIDVLEVKIALPPQQPIVAPYRSPTPVQSVCIESVRVPQRLGSIQLCDSC